MVYSELIKNNVKLKKFIGKTSFKRMQSMDLWFYCKDFNYLREGEMEHEAIKKIIEKENPQYLPHEGFWHSNGYIS